MKQKLFILFVVFITLITGCKAETTPTPAASVFKADVSSSPSPTVTTMPTSMQEPTPSLSDFVPDNDIPDVVPDPQTMMANSTYLLNEDSNNIYYLDEYYVHYGGLYCISKTDKSVKLISDSCSGFTLSGDKIYYVSLGCEDNDYLDYIVRYDIKTGKSAKIKEPGQPIYYIACYGNKIYYTMESAKEYNDEEYHSSLYSCNLDGSGTKKLIGSALSFCIYKNKIYYVKPEGEEGDGDLCIYNIKTGKKTMTDVHMSLDFEIAHDRIFHDNFEEYDIKTGKNIELIPEDYYILGLFGQYVIYTNYEENHPAFIYAYDVINEKSFPLIDVTGMLNNGDIDIYTGIDNVYIEIYTSNGTGDLYLYWLTIKNGRAIIEKLAKLNYGMSIIQ